MTPAWFNQELAALGDVAEIIVRINSGGGDVFAANAIYTRLRDLDAKITVKIDGWAASAATIIAMAGDTIKIAKNGLFMVHDPAITAAAKDEPVVYIMTGEVFADAVNIGTIDAAVAKAALRKLCIFLV